MHLSFRLMLCYAGAFPIHVYALSLTRHAFPHHTCICLCLSRLFHRLLSCRRERARRLSAGLLHVFCSCWAGYRTQDDAVYVLGVNKCFVVIARARDIKNHPVSSLIHQWWICLVCTPSKNPQVVSSDGYHVSIRSLVWLSYSISR